MLKYGIEKLNEQRLTIPKAGGLVIAPNIAMAEYMAEILEMLEGKSLQSFIVIIEMPIKELLLFVTPLKNGLSLSQ